jgi:hypothetical protein
MNLTIDAFYKSFYEDFDTSRRKDALIKADDFFTNLMFEYLGEIGEVEEPVVCSYRDNSGFQLNGFQFADDYSSVDLFVSLFNDTESLLSVAPGDISALLNRGANVYRRVISGKIDQFSADSDVYDCVNNIHEHLDTLHDVRVIALTNGVVKNMDFQPLKIGDATVSFRLWDMDRLFKCSTSGQMHEEITIDCEKVLGHPINAVYGGESEKTKIYLAVIPGKFLAQVYQEYGAKLLERNVRAFLQLKGNVNKGIRETLINEPALFLAYNNGITVTASSIAADEGKNNTVEIKRINDFQVVNGGQTTVSLYRALIDKTAEVDFDKVFVQMKLAVVENVADMDEIVPNISRYSNSQNSVTIADFSSNDPYQRKLEALSRSTWTPAIAGKQPVNWFYERTRGQYAEELSKEVTPSKRRIYKETHPLITKTDLAKVLFSWDGFPAVVALGAQKCFARFVEQMKSSQNFEPSQSYYQHCIAKTILFRQIERIVLEQKFGGYKADIVAYTYFKFNQLTKSCLNLDDVWEKQDISSAAKEQIQKIAVAVQKIIVSEPNGGNISEYCKTQRCVKAIEDMTIDLDAPVASELVAKPVVDDNTTVLSAEPKLTAEQLETIANASIISGEEWQAIAAWAKENNLLMSWQRSLMFSMANLKWRKKDPTYKQALRGLEARDKAIALGFRM